MTKETWAYKDPILVDQQPAKEACDSTGCGVAAKVTLAGQEFRFCCSRSHRMTFYVIKQKKKPNSSEQRENKKKKKKPRRRNFHQSHVSQAKAQLGAYTQSSSIFYCRSS